MDPSEAPGLYSWILDQQAAARRKCELVASCAVRWPSGTAASIRQALTQAAEMAAVTAELESWNEVLADFRHRLAEATRG